VAKVRENRICRRFDGLMFKVRSTKPGVYGLRFLRFEFRNLFVSRFKASNYVALMGVGRSGLKQINAIGLNGIKDNTFAKNRGTPDSRNSYHHSSVLYNRLLHK